MRVFLWCIIILQVIGMIGNLSYLATADYPRFVEHSRAQDAWNVGFNVLALACMAYLIAVE